MPRAEGIVFVDHDQFVVGQEDAETYKVVTRGSLVEAGPGFIALYTGISYGPARVAIELLSSEPDRSLVYEWEVVEQASLATTKPIVVMALDGSVVESIEPIPSGTYYIRAHANGRDLHTGLEVSDPSEYYFFQFWPTTHLTSHVETVKKIDRAWPLTTSPPTTKTSIPTPDFSYVYVRREDGEISRVDSQSDEAQAVYDWVNDYGGRPLSEALAATSYAKYMAAYDRDLLDRVESGDAELQRDFARWCAHRAFDRAGLSEVAWLKSLLNKLDAGELAVSDLEHVQTRLDEDRSIPKSLVSGLPGESELVQQHQALKALANVVADGVSPLKAAVWSYRFAARTYGMEYQQLIDEANQAFPPLQT
jgi:hypothetical protein